MTTLQELYCIAWLLYCVQSSHVIKGAPILFRRRWPGRWKVYDGAPITLFGYLLIPCRLFPLFGEICVSGDSLHNSSEQRLRTEYNKAKKQYRMVALSVQRLGIYTTSLFFIFFCYAPALLFFIQGELAFFYIVGVIFLASMVITVDYWLSHRRIWPEQKEARFSNTIMLLLYPPAAMRACDLLLAGTFSDCDPLVAAAIVCKQEDFLRLAGRHLRERKLLRGESIEGYFFLLRKYKVKMSQIFAPPSRSGESTVAFCPVCLTEYTRVGFCKECMEIPLTSFVPSKVPAEPASR